MGENTARKQNLKRVLMYMLVLIGILFVAMVAYFFARNDEVIALTVEEGSIIHVNKGDTFALPISHEDKDADTKIEVSTSAPEILSFSEATNTFVAEKGGLSSITINTTNKHFGPFRFDVLVGEGTSSNPYYISSAKQFSEIGKTVDGSVKWKLSDSYELLNDIDLSSLYSENTYFEPIGNLSENFSGSFNGNGYSILNLKVKSDLVASGLFGVIGVDGKVENFNIVNGEVSSSGAYAGLVCGVNYGFIGKVNVSGKVTASASSSSGGGIAGMSAFTSATPTISMSSAKVTINSFKNMGGIVGDNQSGVIFNCYSESSFKADVEGVNKSNLTAGGLVGKNSAGNYSLGTDSLYKRAVIKNCYTIVNSFDSEINFGALIGSNSEENNEYLENNKYISNYGFSSVSAPLVQSGKDSLQESELALKTKEQLQNEDTFVGWNFNDVWVMNAYPQINVEASYQALGVIEPGSEVLSKADLVEALNKIIAHPELNLTYTINVGGEVEIDCATDLGISNWTPIGTEANPFKGSLIVEDGTTLTIKNCNIEDKTNAGFFGVVDNVNSVIKNIKFKNFTISNSSYQESRNAGVVCAKLVSGIIEDCYIDNAKISDFANAGFVVGQNINGSVDNCLVGTLDVENNCAITNRNLSLRVCYGGIVGLSSGNVTNCVVDYCEITNEVRNNVSSEIGGIVGSQTSTSNTKIENSYNKSLKIVNNDVKGIVGGVVGTLAGKSTVRSCYNLGKAEVSTVSDSLAGGVAGYVGTNAKVERSFSSTPEIKGRLVGGVVANSYGTISECYSAGEYKGFHIGGLAYKNEGTIINCYTIASVIGLGDSKGYYVAGLVAFLPENGNIKYCFSTATITGANSTLLAETSARVRYPDWVNWVERNWVSGIVGGDAYKPGNLSNCVVVNYGSAKVQGKFMGMGKSTWIDCSDDDCKGTTNNDPFEKAGFRSDVVGSWTFNVGEYPTLTNVVTEAIVE